MASTSILRQGLQYCLEQQVPEHRVLINKLSPKRLTFSHSKISSQEAEVEESEEVNVHFNELQNQHDNSDIGGWSFLQALANPSDYPNQENKENEVYIHPLVKCSSSSLNTKSLEMCTESLGSETGSDISENIEEYSYFLPERRSKCREMVKKHNREAIFPPPLTSISGTNGVQVRPHREGGRLVLKMTTITSYKSYFQAERANGRLRLSLFYDNYEQDEAHVEEEENEDEAEEQDSEHDEMKNGSRKAASENGVGEYLRPSKCKENGSRIQGIPSWEPFWVAIS